MLMFMLHGTKVYGSENILHSEQHFQIEFCVCFMTFFFSWVAVRRHAASTRVYRVCKNARVCMLVKVSFAHIYVLYKKRA